MPQSRQLVAIMFTDIVGYTALMGNDEHKAFEFLILNRRIQKPIIEQHNGRWIKELGDGVLASFPTVSEAVNAAIKIQESCNRTKSFQLRIGIHQGEVVFEDDDIFGDAVNIASRIETLGVPGSILFSKKVADELKNKIEFNTVSLGNFELKNVGEPMEVFALANEGLKVPVREEMKGKLKEVESKTSNNRYERPILLGAVILLLAAVAVYIYLHFSNAPVLNDKGKSIAVLPFRNESVDKEKNGPFCNGMMLAVLKNLTWMKELECIAPQSVEKYRDTKMSIPEIASELGGIKYIAQASVQRDENDVKISVSLINAQTGQQIYADDFTGKMENVFAMQESIAKKIARSLQIEISPEEKSRIERVATKNTKALDNYFEAEESYRKYAFTTNKNDTNYWRIQSLCDKAIALDSSIAEAYVLKAKAYMNKYGDNNKKVAQTKLFTDTLFLLTQKAASLDSNSADAFVMLSRIYALTGSQNKRFEFLQKALSINPRHFEAIKELSWYYFKVLYDSENAIRYAKKALLIDPQSFMTSSVNIYLYWYYLSFCDFEKAEYYIQKVIHQEINLNDKGEGLWNLAHLKMVLGKGDEVLAIANKNMKYKDSLPLYQVAEVYCRFKHDYTRAVSIYDRVWRKLPNRQNANRYAIALWKSGRKADARRLMDSTLVQERLFDSLGRRKFENYDVAGIYVFIGEKERAYKILRYPPEDIYVWGFGAPFLIKTDALFDNIRNDKEFKDLVQKAIDTKAKLREKIRNMEEKGEL